jgi:nucleoside-diphosphate-sugar epimerase
MVAKVWVIGADGLVGQILADAFEGAERVVYREAARGERHVRDLPARFPDDSVVMFAAGFSVHPGLTAREYQRTHVQATREVVARLGKGGVWVQVSSAAVHGVPPATRDRAVGEHPERFIVPEYAHAKLEAEQVARDGARARDARLVVLRPSTFYRPGHRSLFQTFARFARRGIGLRVLPGAARHHFCGSRLFADVARGAIRQAHEGRREATWTVADPFSFSNEDIAAEMSRLARRRLLPLPLPLGALAPLLQRGPSSSRARFDVRGRGNLLRYLVLDVLYDGEPAMNEFGLDVATYGRHAEWLETLAFEFSRGVG